MSAPLSEHAARPALRSRRPHGRTLVAALLIGVLTTIAVSWTAALLVRETLPTSFDDLYDTEGWTRYETPDGPWTLSVRGGHGWRKMLVYPPGKTLVRRPPVVPERRRLPVLVRPLEATPEAAACVVLEARGWPMPALERRLVFPRVIVPSRAQPASPFAWALPVGDARLPLVPTWPGFLVDTLLYTALGLVVLRGLDHLRRARRRRRGRCPACGYPVGSSSTCSECGGPVVAAA